MRAKNTRSTTNVETETRREKGEKKELCWLNMVEQEQMDTNSQR